MTLNVAQYLAPLNSGQVLNGYSQGVRQGTGITIATDGTISLDVTGASTLGFLTSGSTPAPVFNWSTVPGTSGAILQNDGAGNVYWATDYIKAYPPGSAFPHTGAATIPSGGSGNRPASIPGLLRYNTDFGRLEFNNGGSWLPVTPASGSVFSFVTNLTPTANAPGDLWLDTATNQAKVWNGVSWVPTSPPATALVPGLVKVGSNVQVTPDGTVSVLDTVGVAGLVSNVGVTTVTDNTSSFSIDSALSANQGRLLQDQINALMVATNLTLAGLISGAGVMTYVTPEGALQGFTVGGPLPAPSVTNDEYFVILESGGGFTPPGGVFTTVTQGDWFLSTGATWQFLNVGYDPPIASTTQFGLTRLATDAETQAGTSSSLAITPAGLFAAFASGAVDAADVLLNPAINGNTTVQTALTDAVYDITSTGNTVTLVETATGKFNVEVTQASTTQLGGAEIATDAETQALTSDSLIVTPLKLGNLFSSGILNATGILLSPTINGKTNVQSALADAVYNIASSDSSVTIAETAVGQVDLTVTQATETQIGGAQIATQAETDAGLLDNVFLTPQKLAGFISSGQIVATEIPLSPAINGNTTVQTALADAVYDITSTGLTLGITTTATGLFNLDVVQATTTQRGGAEMATSAEALAGTDIVTIVNPNTMRLATVYKADFNAKGDLLSASANDTPVILSVGTDGQYLRADSTQTTGLVWDTLSASDIVVSPAINGNTNLNTILQDAIYDVTSANTSITVAIAATGLVTLTAVDATTAQRGVVELATAAEVITGTSTTLVATADGVRQAAVYKTDYNAKGDILSASANDTPSILSVGTNGQYLRADSTQTTGLIWDTVQASDIAVSPAINGSTDLNTILQDAIYDVTSANTSITVAIAATGLVTLTAVDSTTTQKGVVELSTAAEVVTGTSTTLAVTPDGVRTATVYKSDFNAKGDILSASTNDTPSILSVGTDGQYLRADSTQTTGLIWDTLAASDIAVSPSINGNTNLNTILQDAVYDLNSANSSITITETATGINDIVVAQATETLLAGAEIATQVETEAGADDARIVTPKKLRTATVYKSDFNAKGDILSASTNDTPLILPVGTNAQYLVADNTAATGLKWYTLPSTVGVASLVSNLGLTTITDNVTSTSIDSALSANQGKLLQDQISALTVASNLTFAGVLNSVGTLTYVTTEGAAAGFTVGSTLPVAAAGNKEYFVICEQAGTITPPGGAATAVTQGDWFVSTGAAWQFLNVGFDVAYATTTQSGVVELATDAETQTGTDTLRVLTPSNLTSRTSTETRTGIAELATQVETEAGADDTRIVTPLKLRTSTVYKSDFNAKGDLLSATANDTPSILGVGTTGQVLTVDLATATGLKWASQTATAYAIYNLDDISGSFTGAAVSFPLTIGGVAYAPNPTSNIMVFIGGIAQTPGATGAYTVSGSTITFTSAPPSGASFYATTVR